MHWACGGYQCAPRGLHGVDSEGWNSASWSLSRSTGAASRRSVVHTARAACQPSAQTTVRGPLWRRHCVAISPSLRRQRDGLKGWGAGTVDPAPAGTAPSQTHRAESRSVDTNGRDSHATLRGLRHPRLTALRRNMPPGARIAPSTWPESRASKTPDLIATSAFKTSATGHFY